MDTIVGLITKRRIRRKQKKLQDKWKKLDCFLKASNISAADYGTVIAKLSKKVSVEELAQLEHMRWCRFYYLNYWKSGIQR